VLYDMKLEHTLVEERLCTGNQSCSPCKIGKVVLRRISASVHDSDYMLEWRGPVFFALEPALGWSTGLSTDSEHKKLAGRMAGQVEAEAHDRLDR
jgi:hypothetical protein